MKSPSSLLLLAALWDHSVYGAVANPRQHPNPNSNGLGLLPPYLAINASIGILPSPKSTSSSKPVTPGSTASSLTPTQLTSTNSDDSFSWTSLFSSSNSSTPLTSSSSIVVSSSRPSQPTTSNLPTPSTTSPTRHNSTRIPSTSEHQSSSISDPPTPKAENVTVSTIPRLPSTFQTITASSSRPHQTTVYPLHPSFTGSGGDYSHRPNATEKCTPITDGMVISVYDVRYTSTITIEANQTHLLALFPQPTTSSYCNNQPDLPHPYPSSAVPKQSTSRFGPYPTLTAFTSSEPDKGTKKGSKHPRPTTAPKSTGTPDHQVTTVTIITTAKQPSVSVKNPPPVPRYSQTWGGNNGGHHPDRPGDGHGGKLPDGANLPEPTFTLTAIGTTVIINDHTYTGIGRFQTSIVTIGDNVFTIGPDSVVGGGASIRRPMPAQVTRAIGGVPVTMAGNNAIVGGQTLTLPPAPTVTHINGHDITLGPGGVTVNGHTFTREAPKPSNWVVTGGEMMTVAGESVVVIHSTTLTYGPGIPEKVTAINGDVISIEPDGVSVHGKNLGGPDANPTDTTYELVGAATIGKIPPSMIVVNGKTYSVGPGVGLKTIMAGDQTLTVGPFGVVLGSVTTSFPLAATMVTTFTASRTNDGIPAETGGEMDEEDSGGMALQPDKKLGGIILGIAIGVLVLG